MKEINHYKTIKSKIKEVLKAANNLRLINRDECDFKEMIDSFNGLSEHGRLLLENHKDFIDSIYQSYNNEKLKFSKYPLVIHIQRQSRELEDYLDDNRRYLTDSDKSQLERFIGGIDDCRDVLKQKSSLFVEWMYKDSQDNPLDQLTNQEFNDHHELPFYYVFESLSSLSEVLKDAIGDRIINTAKYDWSRNKIDLYVLIRALYESEAIKSVDRSAPVSFPEICKMITSMFANVESSSKSIEDQLRQFKRSSKALKGAHFIETLDSLIHGYINQNNT